MPHDVTKQIFPKLIFYLYLLASPSLHLHSISDNCSKSSSPSIKTTMPNLLGANRQLHLRHTEMSLLGSTLGYMLPGQAMSEKDKSREMMEALYQLLELPWRRKWLHTPVFLPGDFNEQRSLVGYSSWGCKESNRTEQLTLSLFFRAPSHWGTLEERIG